jgi:hypothetical protein
MCMWFYTLKSESKIQGYIRFKHCYISLLFLTHYSVLTPTPFFFFFSSSSCLMFIQSYHSLYSHKIHSTYLSTSLSVFARVVITNKRELWFEQRLIHVDTYKLFSNHYISAWLDLITAYVERSSSRRPIRPRHLFVFDRTMTHTQLTITHRKIYIYKVENCSIKKIRRWPVNDVLFFFLLLKVSVLTFIRNVILILEYQIILSFFFFIFSRCL